MGEGLVAIVNGVEFYADGTVRGEVEVSDRCVFLVSPAMRSFLFLDRDDRQLSRYAGKVDKAAKELPNFIPLSVSLSPLRKVARHAENAIVLIDEFGAGWHPERCYNVTKELGDRYPRTQFVVATHSFDICDALTPSHVKNLGATKAVNCIKD